MGYLARAQWSRDPWTRQVRFCFVGPCNKGCRITKGAFACDEFFQAAENLAWNIWKFFSRHYSIYFWSGNYRSDAEQRYGWCHRCCISQFEMESRNHVHSWSIQSHYTSFWISTAWVSHNYCKCGVLTWSQWLGISGRQDHMDLWYGPCDMDGSFENNFSEEVQLHGIKFICDTKNISWKHLNVVPPKIKQKWSAAVSKAYPIRIRGIIYVNVRI